MSRLILLRLVLAFCALVSSSVALAQDKYWEGTINGYRGVGTDAGGACSMAIGKAVAAGQQYRYETFTLNSGGTQGSCRGYVGTSSTLTTIMSVLLKTCPTATPYWDAAAGACVAVVPPPPSCSSTASGSDVFPYGDANGSTESSSLAKSGVCIGGCYADWSEVTECHSLPPARQVYCTLKWKQNGSKCAGGEPSPAPAPGSIPPTRTPVPPTSAGPSGKCPLGTVQGGMDSSGIPICIGTGTNPNNAPPPPPKTEATKSETLPDGSTKTTTTITTKNADGSTTTDTTITITKADGTKDVSGSKDTSQTPAGQPGKDDSNRDDDKYDLCKKNPELTICRNSSIAGTCGAITCIGDAIQCATLQNIAKAECRAVEEGKKLADMPESTLGKSILGGTDPSKGAIDAAIKGTEVDMSQQALSDAAFLSSATCLADRSFTVGGKTIAVSFSRLCPALLPLRYAVMASAWIVAYLIVARSVLNS